MHDPECTNCLNAIRRAPIRTQDRRGNPIATQEIIMGGTPSKQTPKDMRLKANKPKPAPPKK